MTYRLPSTGQGPLGHDCHIKQILLDSGGGSGTDKLPLVTTIPGCEVKNQPVGQDTLTSTVNSPLEQVPGTPLPYCHSDKGSCLSRQTSVGCSVGCRSLGVGVGQVILTKFIESLIKRCNPNFCQVSIEAIPPSKEYPIMSFHVLVGKAKTFGRQLFVATLLPDV